DPDLSFQHYSPPRRTIHRSSSPNASNFPPKVIAAKAPMVNVVKGNWGNPQHALKDKGVIDSRCLRHMVGNMSYLSDFEEINGGYVAFGDNPKGGKISGKGKIKTGKLDFDDVYFVKEIKFNLFSVSQMCDKKNSVLFTDTECIVLSPEFKLPDENQVLLRAEAVNTACYVQYRVLVTKPQNKTPYELLLGGTPSIGFMRHFGCPVTILNIVDPLGKFDGKADEGFLVGYSVSSKAFRVFNSRTRIVQETLHINFLENKPNVAGSGPTWLFDIDTLTKTMNYQPVTLGKNPEFEGRKPKSEVHVSPSSSAQTKKHDDKTKREAKAKSPVESTTGYRNLSAEFEDFFANSINEVNDADS
nr:retrovirus-related Pol polyprotein from transposon TNT 1-94 [Tanacetum cinerariifolium]